MANCRIGECEGDPIYEEPTVIPPYPVDGGGGGHEFVTELPVTGVDGVEYILMDDISDQETYRGTYVYDKTAAYWIQTSGSGGGGDASLTETIISNTAVGAAPAGTTFSTGLSFTNFAKKILISEIAPTATFTASNSGVKERGTSVTSTMTLTVSNVGSASELTAVDFYVGNTLAGTVVYSGSNTFTYTHPTPITSDTTVKAILKYKKSDNTNGTIEKTASYTFVYASYYGIVAATGDVDADVVTSLTKDIRTSRGKTVSNITTDNERIVFAYPASFGNLTSIKDGNGFENIDSYAKQTLSISGTSYNVYVLITPMTTTNAKQVYA